MCFQNIPDVFLHSCLPTWAIPLRRNNSLLLFSGTLLQFAGHCGKFATIYGTLWSLSGMLQAGTPKARSRNQDICFIWWEYFHSASGSYRILPLFSKILTNVSTSHSFTQNSEDKGITITDKYPCRFNNAKLWHHNSVVMGNRKSLKNHRKRGYLTRTLSPAILFSLGTTNL